MTDHPPNCGCPETVEELQEVLEGKRVTDIPVNIPKRGIHRGYRVKGCKCEGCNA